MPAAPDTERQRADPILQPALVLTLEVADARTALALAAASHLGIIRPQHQSGVAALRAAVEVLARAWC